MSQVSNERKPANTPGIKSRTRRLCSFLLGLPVGLLFVVITYAASFLFSTFWIDVLCELEKNWTSAQNATENSVDYSTSIGSWRSGSAGGYDSRPARPLNEAASKEVHKPVTDYFEGRQGGRESDIEMQK